MKNRLIIVIVLLTFLSQAQITFNNYYKTGYVSYNPMNVFEQSDSSLVFLNYVKDSATGRQDLNMFRLNKFGNLMQNKIINQNKDYLGFFNGFKSIIKISSSSYLTTAGSYTGSTSGIIFTKINATTLDTIKTVYFDDNVNNYYVNNIVKISTNKFYFIGGKGNISIQYPVMFHLDSNLNVINTYTLNNSINASTTNAVLNPLTKKLLLAGTITYGVNQVNIGFIEADTLGVVTNTMIIPYADIQGITQLKYCAFDNSYVFNGNCRTSKVGNTSNLRLQITKLNTSSLNVVWSKTYGSAAGNNLFSMVMNSDGSIVSSGIYRDSTGLSSNLNDTKGIILKVGSNGDSLWMRQYNNYQTPPNPPSYFEALYGIERTYDGGYIVCGGVMNQPKSKAWVIKTDSMGCVTAGCGSIINGTYTATTGVEEFSLANTRFKVYPNPVTSNLTIELNTSVFENTSIELLNTLGQTILTEHLTTRSQLIDVSNLASGIYFVKLVTNQQLQRIIKLIKE
jgi:hypothetical protein